MLISKICSSRWNSDWTLDLMLFIAFVVSLTLDFVCVSCDSLTVTNLDVQQLNRKNYQYRKISGYCERFWWTIVIRIRNNKTEKNLFFLLLNRFNRTAHQWIERMFLVGLSLLFPFFYSSMKNTNERIKRHKNCFIQCDDGFDKLNNKNIFFGLKRWWIS